VTVLAAVGEGLAEISLTSGCEHPVLGYGGDAANLCVMAARLGVPARLAGRVGDDELGRRLLAFWREQGIDLAHVRTDADAPTGLYVNEPGEIGHRFVYWRNGSAGSRLQPSDLPRDFYERVAMLVVTGVTLAVSASCAAAAEHAIAAARELGARVTCVLNHRPLLGGDPGRLAAVARASDVMIASYDDTEMVFGTRDSARLRELLEGGPAELVLTDGAAGAVVVADGHAVVQPAPQVEVRNAAGAGDALAGAYLAARLRGEAPADSLAWGVAAATLSVRSDGCALAYPSAQATFELLQEMAPSERVPM
jgi:2-dehydro-3-deoxygluconokinase